MTTHTLTAEAVCMGHPDKLCDLIADTITDAALKAESTSRCAIEVMATGSKIIVAGEIACPKTLPIRTLVREALERAGYDPKHFTTTVLLHTQSADIAQGLTESLEARAQEVDALSRVGAGDQGTVYGYATDETKERLPLSLVLSHALVKCTDEARNTGVIKGIHSDGKAQVTLRYKDDKPHVDTVVLSVQHEKEKTLDELKEELICEVIRPTLEKYDMWDQSITILINPTGAFTTGGPDADCGLTGRKLMVDTYGGIGAHGGVAFSGKDASKVDRSSAYMARLIAKTIVDAHLAKKTTVAVSYAIGKAEPVAFEVDTHNTGTLRDKELKAALRDVFDLQPLAIIEKLRLAGGISFADTASYGHFGDARFPWENTEASVKKLQESLKV